MKTREELIEILWQNEIESMNNIELKLAGVRFNTQDEINQYKKHWLSLISHKTTEELDKALVQIIMNKARRIENGETT